MLRPRFSAYISPNSRIFRFFDKKNVTNNPMMMLVAKTGIFDVPTPEKLPIPQITKAWMSSFKLKNLRISVIEPAK